MAIILSLVLKSAVFKARDIASDVRRQVSLAGFTLFVARKYSTICGTEIQCNVCHGNIVRFKISGHSCTDWVDKFYLLRNVEFHALSF